MWGGEESGGGDGIDAGVGGYDVSGDELASANTRSMSSNASPMIECNCLSVVNVITNDDQKGTLELVTGDGDGEDGVVEDDGSA